MNYFTDNRDLSFIFTTTDLSDIIGLYENNFSEKELYGYAPDSFADACENYRRILEVTGDIAARIIALRSEQIDREPHILKDGKVILSPPLQKCLQALRQAELMGVTISRKYGGLNLPSFLFTMMVEIISQADASIQNIFGLQGISSIIEEYADETLKQKYLPRFADGSATGAMALTEDEAGSDLQNVKMKAGQHSDGTWRLKGVKRFITNGCAEVLLVLARSEPGTTDGLGLSLFLCEGDSTVTVRRLEEKMGIHGSPTCELSFQDTPAYLIGERQRGLVTYVLALLNGARLATAAQAVGISQAAFNEAQAYAQARKQYGRKIETIPAVAEMLTTMKVAIEASRAFVYETARIMDLSVGMARRLHSENVAPDEKKILRKKTKKFERLTNLLTSCVKYYCSEMSIWVTRDAMQVMGGSGYMQDYPAERYYRDARITNIYEGTSQMQVLSAVKGILNGTMEKYFEECSHVEWNRNQRALAKKLLHGRKLLAAAVEHLNGRKDNQLVDLCSRNLVDMATEILMGYLLLQQSRHSSRKEKIARMFITKLEPILIMKARHIKSTDKRCLQDYAQIVEKEAIVK